MPIPFSASTLVIYNGSGPLRQFLGRFPPPSAFNLLGTPSVRSIANDFYNEAVRSFMVRVRDPEFGSAIGNRVTQDELSRKPPPLEQGCIKA